MSDSPEIQSGPESIDGKFRQNHKNGGANRIKNGLFFILLISGLIYLLQRESIVTVDCTPEIIAQKPDVIMLGAWWCTYCRQAKAYFQHNNIHYCEYDMEQTTIGKQLYQKYGGGLPVLLIGKYQLNGFDEHQVEKALSLLEK